LATGASPRIPLRELTALPTDSLAGLREGEGKGKGGEEKKEKEKREREGLGKR